MRKLITPKDMQNSEKAYFDSGAARSIDVMERAAEAFAEEIRALVPKGGKVYFACGTGGNGGDGLACARILKDEYETAVLLPSDPKTEDAKTNLARAEEAGVKICQGTIPKDRPDAWGDALFGTGLSRAVTGETAALIRRINADHALGTKVISADIPSGLDGFRGKMYDPCVHADSTVTFGYMKTGLVLADGMDAAGHVRIADVGFPEFDVNDGFLMENEDIANLLPPRKRNLHKGQCGHLLLTAGSFGMAGAAVMAARAALRSGVGLLTIAAPISIVPILQTLAPQAMCVPLPEKDGAIAAEAAPILKEALRGKTACAIGCGLSLRAAPECIKVILESGLPSVIDADALNLVAKHDSLRALLTEKHILTPHPGEAVRLLPELPDAPTDAAKALSAACGSASVLLKGASCVIMDGTELYISTSGCSGMARGGSGDSLTGIIGALIAEPSERSLALSAALASEIHGHAGELAEAALGNRAMNAGDLPDYLPQVFAEAVKR